MRSTQFPASWTSKCFPRRRATHERGSLPSNSSTEVEMPSKTVNGIRSSHDLVEGQLGDRLKFGRPIALE